MSAAPADASFMHLPKRLSAPGTIGLVAPSGHIVDPEILDAAIARLNQRGWRIKEGANVRKKWKYFSATDAERATELQQMALDPEVDVIMGARGGYGLSRILGMLDYTALAASRKAFVGFSDFTALSLAMLTRAGYVTFSGPMARVDFGHEDVNPLMESNFWPLLSKASHETPLIESKHDYPEQEIDGIVWGTNLSLVAHLVGTPYFPNLHNGILVVEDIGEEPYHVERCFMQLKHAGVLEQQRAIILATFNGFDLESDIAKRLTMEDVAETLRKIAPCPVLTGFPFGHAAEKISLPIGAPARIEIQRKGYKLTFGSYNE
jgi:muramoyltetrapeptide carboxypeptidase